jgi:hypothetical protein
VLKAVLDVEVSLTLSGVRFPAGGSRVVVATKERALGDHEGSSQRYRPPRKPPRCTAGFMNPLVHLLIFIPLAALVVDHASPSFMQGRQLHSRPRRLPARTVGPQLLPQARRDPLGRFALLRHEQLAASILECTDCPHPP